MRDTAQVDVDEARDGRGRAKRLPLLNEPFHLWRPRYRRLRNPKSVGFAPGKSGACPSHALTSLAIGGLKDGALRGYMGERAIRRVSPLRRRPRAGSRHFRVLLRTAMAPCETVSTRGRRLAWALPLLPALALTLGACGEEKTVAEPAPRPVRTITAGKGDIGETVALTGQILAENEVSLSFPHWRAHLDQICRRRRSRRRRTRFWRDSIRQDELNALRSAQAASVRSGRANGRGAQQFRSPAHADGPGVYDQGPVRSGATEFAHGAGRGSTTPGRKLTMPKTGSALPS